MRKEIVMNVGPGETRVAIMENGRLVELTFERDSTPRNAGNIYKGRVENVLPGMGAAFVDIGMERNAFLYVDDVHVPGALPAQEDEVELPRPTIRDMVQTGQEIMVQMVKEPIGTKGARVTTNLTIPGRYVVLMPTVDYIGVSRRIEDEGERARLRTLAAQFRSAPMGIIVRTAAEGADEKDLAVDCDFLLNVWRRIQKKVKTAPTPSVLYRDHDLLYRIMRDLFTKEVDRLVIDLPSAYEKALDMLRNFAPHLKSRVHPYTGDRPIFEDYGIENEIEQALQRRVWLDCGAYLVFDQTEALNVIDVNTGKFTGHTCLRDTILQTNLAAAVEIGRQIRLRNLGGIIIVDFIDMDNEQDRHRVLASLTEAVRADKIKTNVLGFTSLGLVELTRKKIRQSLAEMLQDDCHYCAGTGRTISLQTMALAVERKIQGLCQEVPAESLLLAMHPSIAALIIGPGGGNLAKIESAVDRTLFIKGQDDLSPGDLRLLANGTRAELEALALPVHEGDIRQVEVIEVHMTNPADGIARIEGYVVDIEGAGHLIGQTVKVKITKAYRTYARGRLFEQGS